MKKRGHKICRIYKKAQIIKNLAEKALNNIHEVPSNTTTLTIEWFFKGVWWISGDCSWFSCFDLKICWCSGLPSALKQNILKLMLLITVSHMLSRPFKCEIYYDVIIQIDSSAAPTVSDLPCSWLHVLKHKGSDHVFTLLHTSRN